MSPTVTRVVEDCLAEIWKSQEWGGKATTTELSRRMGVTASTVSSTLRKLTEEGLLRYRAYGPIELTASGREIAVQVVRRHRIVETYLVEKLGFTPSEVHEEADRLEHAVSEALLERMAAAVHHPSQDPHGDPIPDVAGTVPATPQGSRLSLAEAGDRGVVLRMSDREPEVLEYLRGLGLRMGQDIEVLDVLPGAGVLRLRAADQTVDVPQHAAHHVWVGQPRA